MSSLLLYIKCGESRNNLDCSPVLQPCDSVEIITLTMKPQLNIFSRCCRENTALSGLYMQGLKGNGQLMVLLSVWFSAFVSVHLISWERCLWFTKLSCPFFFIPFFPFLPFEHLVSICYMLGMKYEGDKWWFSQFITYEISSAILDFCRLSILEWTWQCNMTRLLALLLLDPSALLFSSLQ